MKTFKFYDQTQNQKVKDLLNLLEVKFKVNETDLIEVEDSKEPILDDVTSLVRTLKFSEHSWYVLSIPEDSSYQSSNNSLFEYIKENEIDYLKEISDNEVWITLCNTVSIPDEIYEQGSD